ncbi:MAG: two pore domain potassium channel family protein [Flammeovirgaceae bacterium]|nr:two pore domain potassium channel family protein [Flammeovirgaceae bacterium]
MEDWFDSLYFSIVTFATVGYGDISPVTQLARMVVASEIFISLGTLVMLILAYSMSTNES